MKRTSSHIQPDKKNNRIYNKILDFDCFCTICHSWHVITWASNFRYPSNLNNFKLDTCRFDSSAIPRCTHRQFLCCCFPTGCKTDFTYLWLFHRKEVLKDLFNLEFWNRFDKLVTGLDVIQFRECCARNFESTLHCMLDRVLNYMYLPYYSLNCTPLSPVIITYQHTKRSAACSEGSLNKKSNKAYITTGIIVM